jgi:peptidoglycan/xylan/chitin deacetylase (PgdA/CDA1 family)
MIRRDFVKTLGAFSLSSTLSTLHSQGKTHIISFSFDDGFKKSFYRVSEIHENYGLKACLNVIASAHFPNFEAIDKWILPELMGHLDDWNALVDRGHEVMPHTWEHLNLTNISESKAKKNIDKCLDFFAENLHGYNDQAAVYNYAYNASNDDLDKHLLQRIRAIRTGGWIVLKDTQSNDMPMPNKKFRLGCQMHFQPNNCDHWVEKEIEKFLESEGGWLIVNLHGLDEEGWAPVSTSYYDGLLNRLMKVPHLSIKAVGDALL